MVLFDRRWCLIVFNPWAWQDWARALVTGWLMLVTVCEVLAPGWAQAIGFCPQIDWWHPQTWLATWWRGQL